MRLRLLPGLALALALGAGPAPALAHHGLTMWDETTTHSLDGIVSHELTGFPHWEIKVRDAKGDDWRVDVGNSFEMEKAGLSKNARELPVGTQVHVEGVTTKDSTKLMRPSKIVIGDKAYLFTDKWN